MTTRRFIVAALILVQPALLLGAEGGHGEHHGMSTPLKLLVMSINAGIFFYLLRSSAWPMMKEWVVERRRNVVSALEKADIAKREAEALKRQWSERLANLDREIEDMRAQAHKQIAAERDQILDASRKLAEGIRRDAERAAEQEIRNAQERLRAEVAAQAFRIASQSAPSRIGPGDHKRFIDDFLSQVSK